MPDPTPRRVVLAGAGHAHLHLAANARTFVRAGIELVLVDPGVFWYSGLATGMLGGTVRRRDDIVDPRPLVESSGGRFVPARVERVDPAVRSIVLDSGEPLGYDAFALDIGSEVDTRGIERVDGTGWTVKPIARLWHLRRRLEERLGSASGRPVKAVVVGAGASGCEVAANLEALGGGGIKVTVVTLDARPLPEAPRGASARMAAVFRARGIRLVSGTRVVRVEPGRAVAEDGRGFDADEIVLATGLRAPASLAAMGLTVDASGALPVDATLRSFAHPRIFGAGDCISFAGRSLPRLGVFGVRQAPVLLHNLLAALDDGPPRIYEPQSRWLQILNLGDGSGLALYGPFWWHGRAALTLKDTIDRRWLARYR